MAPILMVGWFLFFFRCFPSHGQLIFCAATNAHAWTIGWAGVQVGSISGRMLSYTVSYAAGLPGHAGEGRGELVRNKPCRSWISWA